jgi:oligopeptide transport system ATP-binding protein
MQASAPLIEVEALTKRYAVGGATVTALDRVTLAVAPEETLAVVGESGSGKTTLARLILAIEVPTAGTVRFQGTPLAAGMPKALRRRIQAVQQNPMSALNPKRTIQQTVELPIRVHGLRPPARYRERAAELLDVVGLTAEHLSRYPSALSGGQRQRVAIARALAAEPDLLVLDEPTSALDVSIQAKVLSLLVDLQRRFKLTYVFITHDLGVVRHIASRVAVLYRGRLVETGTTEAVFQTPRHRYTTMLLASVPVVSAQEEQVKPAWPWDRAGVDLGDRPSRGCAFAPRCPFALDACWSVVPPLTPVDASQAVACHNPAESGAGTH